MNKIVMFLKQRSQFAMVIALAMVINPLLSCANGNTNKQSNDSEQQSQAEQPADTTFHQRKIAVIGAGWLGGTVGKLWVKAGHQVMFSSRHPEELKAMAEELGPNASVGYPKDAAAFGDVLLFAVPYDAIPQLGIDLRDLIKGKIVLDACNGGNGDLGKEVDANGNGPTSQKYLAGTKLVRAFSSEDATAVEASFNRNENPLAIPVAGDDKEAVDIAAQLVRDVRCEPVITGDLSTGVTFQRRTPAFRANTDAKDLREKLGLPNEK